MRRAVRGWSQPARGPEVRAAGGLFGDSSIMPNSVMLGQGSSALVMTEAGAMSISTVMNCVKVLFSDISILPFKAYQGDRFGAKQRIAKQPQIVTQPFGPDLPVAIGMGQIVASISLRGNAYLLVLDTDPLGFPTLLQILHPDMVKVRRDPDTGAKIFIVTSPMYGTNTTYGSDQIKHITGLIMPSALTGLDPISYQRILLGEAADVAQFGANHFRNGGLPGIVIEMPGSGDRKKAREVKDVWEANHAGVVNSHRPAVVFGGAKVTPLTISNENSQFLQTRSFLREEITGWFGVPPQRLQIIQQHASAGGGKGLDTMDQGYATHTLVPLTTVIEQVWDSMIPGDQSTWTGFDFSGLLRASGLERAQIAQIHRLAGIRNRNEIRADEGWAPIPGPDGTDYNLPFATNALIPPVLDAGQQEAAPDDEEQ
jgi:HK97 family phage portal protein